MTVRVRDGDCLDLLAELPGNSIDAVVTDPPYGLSEHSRADIELALTAWLSGDRDHVPTGRGFMGKDWDAFVPPPAVWDECFRVLKPGGHLLAFCGTRTVDLMGMSIRLARIGDRQSPEMRDSLAWLYGSGFPKSRDIGKAIDAENGKHERDLAPFGAYVRECRTAKGWSLRQLDEAMGTNTAASWWEGRKSGVQPPSVEMYGRLKVLLSMDDRHDELVAWAEAQREVIGTRRDVATRIYDMGEGPRLPDEIDITAPATDAAQQWDGWGTALKPAFEPIIVARKPLSERTVAGNVLRWGTGALNIDGCRIGTTKDVPTSAAVSGRRGVYHPMDALTDRGGMDPNVGRWPANVLLDEAMAEQLDQQSGIRPGATSNSNGKTAWFNGGGATQTASGYGDTGGASRFFYVAKAPAKERPTYTKADGTKVSHPTVKPLSLMRQLVRLVTPPGGTVLDPFAGSGPTVEAAILEGLDVIAAENFPDYLPLIDIRIARARRQLADTPPDIPDLFSDEAAV